MRKREIVSKVGGVLGSEVDKPYKFSVKTFSTT